MPLSEMPPPMGTDPDSTPGAEHPLLRMVPPGPMSRSWLTRLQRVECPTSFDSPSCDSTASDMPIVYASALGSNVIDVDGNRFVDLAAGFGSLLLGHLAQRPARALEMQSQRLWTALGDVYPADAKVALIERVVGLYPKPGARALLCQSGSDAVSAALKTAVLNTGRPGVLAFRGSYHGLGYGPLAACGYRESFRSPFEQQLNPHVRFVAFPGSENDLSRALDDARDALASGEIGAVVVEPILGRGGCVVPPCAFLPELATLAQENGALLIADEIWTGLGRAGALLASSRVGVIPDIICLGKGLGGGLPISACVAPDILMQAWKRTSGVVHTSTFQGHALACATGVATIDAIKFSKLPQKAEEVGTRFMHAMRAAFTGIPCVKEVTGAGLMVGVVLDSAERANAARLSLFQKGYLLLTGGIDGNVLTITPPLTIAEPLLDRFAEVAASVLDENSRQ